MKIAVDVDGCLYEWDRTARYMLRTYFDIRGLEGESLTWDHIQHHVDREQWDWLWKEGVELGLFRYGHVVKDAVVGIRRLALSHDLVVVTHRPKQAVKDTIAWLSYVELPFSEYYLLSAGENKSQVKADVLIDDKPDNIVDWLNAGRDAVLFDRSWNQSFDASYTNRIFVRAKGWREVENAITWIDTARES